ncbi:MAG: hypothetical protein NTZ10_01695 [Candidatus Saganbacteria bacterium]|nr:hypothetical protein [Candidatus Saganbacteria bacterium]
MEWALNWLTNGGTSLADEFSLSKRADVIRADIFLALFSEVSEGDYILRPWTRNRPALCKSLFQTVLNNILSNRKLIETAKWMADNMRLYYIDDLGTLYMHSGLKYLLASEKVRNGTASGIQVLKELESELRTALASDTTGCANIFWRMLGKEGFLYSRNIEPGGSFSYDPGDLKRMGVERIVMGHDPLVRVFNVDDKYFFLNLSGNKGVGSFFITPKQIELESSCPDLKIFEKSVIPCQATP